MRHVARLPVAVVIRRRRFVPKVFQVNIMGKGADGLVSRVSLRDRDGLAGPLDRRSTFALFRLLE